MVYVSNEFPTLCNLCWELYDNLGSVKCVIRTWDGHWMLGVWTWCELYAMAFANSNSNSNSNKHNLPNRSFCPKVFRGNILVRMVIHPSSRSAESVCGCFESTLVYQHVVACILFEPQSIQLCPFYVSRWKFVLFFFYCLWVRSRIWLTLTVSLCPSSLSLLNFSSAVRLASGSAIWSCCK